MFMTLTFMTLTMTHSQINESGRKQTLTLQKPARYDDEGSSRHPETLESHQTDTSSGSNKPFAAAYPTNTNPQQSTRETEREREREREERERDRAVLFDIVGQLDFVLFCGGAY